MTARTRTRLTLPAMGVLLLCLTACADTSSGAAAPALAGGSTSPGPAGSTSPAAGGSTSPAAGQSEHVAVTDRYVTEVNAGHSDKVAALFAPDARVDIVGTIFAGRDRIMNDFIGPDVIGTKGRYTMLRRTPTGKGLLVEYNFATGGGLREHFTYEYTVRDGMIHELVGRYV